jgi:hypothetical protein
MIQSAQLQDGEQARPSAQAQDSPQAQPGPQSQDLAGLVLMLDGLQLQGSQVHSSFM